MCGPLAFVFSFKTSTVNLYHPVTLAFDRAFHLTPALQPCTWPVNVYQSMFIKVACCSPYPAVRACRSVLWGRSVFSSIRKFLQFQLTVNFVALVVSFVGALVGGRMPLNVLQVGTCSLYTHSCSCWHSKAHAHIHMPAAADLIQAL